MQCARFILEFLKYPKEVGTFTQSSQPLARKIAQQINGSINIIEFGAGTGSVTLEILRHLPENGQLTCFETNPRFCECLEKLNDSRLKVINDDAANCKQYVDRLECVVSGLPLAMYEKSKREEILDITSESKRFIQLQYSPVLRKKIKNYFSDVKMKFVPFNFPPAFIYICSSS